MNWYRHGTAIFGHDVVAAIDAVKHPASRFESFDDVCAINFANDISIMNYGIGQYPDAPRFPLTGYSFWDSHILASAEASGAELLYSEAMQHGDNVAGLEIRNPFPPDYRG